MNLFTPYLLFMALFGGCIKVALSQNEPKETTR